MQPSATDKCIKCIKCERAFKAHSNDVHLTFVAAADRCIATEIGIFLISWKAHFCRSIKCSLCEWSLRYYGAIHDSNNCEYDILYHLIFAEGDSAGHLAHLLAEILKPTFCKNMILKFAATLVFNIYRFSRYAI